MLRMIKQLNHWMWTRQQQRLIMDRLIDLKVDEQVTAIRRLSGQTAADYVNERMIYSSNSLLRS